MNSLLIPIVLLTLTIFDDERGMAHVNAHIPEGMEHCKYTRDIMIADERATRAAEAKMDKAEVKPRLHLVVASCSVLKLELRGDKT